MSSIKNIFSEKNIPVMGLFDLTYKCNLKCKHCFITEEQRQELALEEIKATLEQLKRNNTFIILFSGGEIFTRSDIIEILNYARKLNFKIEIFTNGTLLDNYLIKELHELSINNIAVSLYATSDKIHDKITGVSGSYRATIDAIELLIRQGISVTIKTTIMKDNFSEVDALYNWSKKRKIHYQLSYTIAPSLDKMRNNQKLRLTNTQIKELLQKKWIRNHVVNLLDEPHLDYGDNVCSAGITSFNISAYGDVFPCAYLRLFCGNIRKESFESAWRSDVMNSIRSVKINDLETCFECKIRRWCTICLGLAWLEHKNWLKSSSDACNRARVKAEVFEFY
ncbi:MAG: radical SAM/SPASM domain-containing protein [bacterium]